MIQTTGGMRVRRHNKRLWFALLGAFVAIFLFTFLIARNRITNEKVEAASLAEFDPGFIISDWQMGNYTSMSEADIQAFLTSKNSCGNRDYNYYLRLSANMNYTWHFKDGHFVCLSEELFGDGEVIGSGETAAHIIWQTAQDYRINPQVMLVLLQKETGLITDPIPNNGDYRKATGYGCPDTAACSSKYYGFKNQVRNAAALFRTVLDGGWTNYPLGNNYVQYNPNAACGGSVINIRSLATSALYRYTPYQPNDGALAAGYGTAYCGAYGNRNFYLYFQDWFGGIKEEEVVLPEVVIEPGERQTDILDNVDYVIVSKGNSNYAIDIYGGIKENIDGINIQLYDKHGEDNQQFRFVFNNEKGFYEIINHHTGKSLNNYGAKRVAETNVQLWERDGSCASFWKIEKMSDGSFVFQSACSELVMDIYGGKAITGSNIQVYYNHDGENQRWVLERAEDVVKKEENTDDSEVFIDENKQYVIVSALNHEYALDIYGGTANALSGSNIQLYNKHKNDNQIFRIIKNNQNNYYEIVNPATDKSLNAYGASTIVGTNVQLWDRDGSCASYWKMIKNTDDTYTIQSSCSDLVLDIYCGRILPEENIQLYSAHFGENQKWLLVGK